MKTPARKMQHSGVYHLMTPITPGNTTANSQFDIWGVVLVVALLFGMADLMRLALTA